MPSVSILDGRAVLAVRGDDRAPFLQGLVSNDVTGVSPDKAVFTAFLTPQGKYLHDFFVVAGESAFLLDVEADRRPDLLRRLKLYKLRSKVELLDLGPDMVVAAVFGEDAAESLALPDEAGAARSAGGCTAFVDPRLPAMGVRLLGTREQLAAAVAEAKLTAVDTDQYERWRLALGVPDASRDLLVEKSALLESNYDALNAISWSKGCYMGQELTARTRYRGLVKRRLIPVEIEGPLPAPGTPVTLDGREVGDMRSAGFGLGLASLRLDVLGAGAGTLKAGSAVLRPRNLFWLNAELNGADQTSGHAVD